MAFDLLVQKDMGQLLGRRWRQDFQVPGEKWRCKEGERGVCHALERGEPSNHVSLGRSGGLWPLLKTGGQRCLARTNFNWWTKGGRIRAKSIDKAMFSRWETVAPSNWTKKASWKGTNGCVSFICRFNGSWEQARSLATSAIMACVSSVL